MKLANLFILLFFVNATIFAQVKPDISLYLDSNTSTIDGAIIGKKLATANILTKKDGHLTSSKNTSEIIWNITIKVIGAKAIVPYFDELTINNGGKIRAYSLTEEDHTNYFHKNENKLTSAFALPFVKGEKIVLEAVFPNQLSYDAFSFSMSEVGGLSSLMGFGDAPACFTNVHCSEGNLWKDQIRSVAKYMTVSGQNIGFCSGGLINNTASDCKNYFLSAQHCAISSSIAEFGQFVFYFNYEANSCTSPSSDEDLNNETVVGCAKIASSGSSSSLPPDGSDFLLMELNPIPAAYNIYYAGWNRNSINQLQGNGAIIQHPQGDLKKIAFWNNVDVSFTSAAHLEATCISSANGDGIVEPMSSGSPFFDATKNIIGNVTAGASGCISNITGSPTAVGGRFEVHWDQNGATNILQLKPWLDPTNSGVMSMNGRENCEVVSVNELQINGSSLALYPNPSNQYISIKSDLSISTILFYSIEGKLLLETFNTNTIDVSELPSGIVIVEVHTENGEIARNKMYKQ